MEIGEMHCSDKVNVKIILVSYIATSLLNIYKLIASCGCNHSAHLYTYPYPILSGDDTKCCTVVVGLIGLIKSDSQMLCDENITLLR